MESMNQKIGTGSIGCVITGITSLIAALFPFLIGDFQSAGLFLIAAALSFGLLAIAILKK